MSLSSYWLAYSCSCNRSFFSFNSSWTFSNYSFREWWSLCLSSCSWIVVVCLVTYSLWSSNSFFKFSISCSSSALPALSDLFLTWLSRASLTLIRVSLSLRVSVSSFSADISYSLMVYSFLTKSSFASFNLSSNSCFSASYMIVPFASFSTVGSYLFSKKSSRLQLFSFKYLSAMTYRLSRSLIVSFKMVICVLQNKVKSYSVDYLINNLT